MRWRFFARRLAMLVASLLVASFVIFGALYLAPGNPISALSGGRTIPASSVAVLEARYHLNEPFLAQYWYWLKNALHGNLGISIVLRENVSTLIASRIWTTAGLVLYAALIIVVLGIGLGILSGLRPGAFDTSTLVTTAVSAAIPSFVAAIVLILVFAVKLGWFPALGNGTDLAQQHPALHAARGRPGHLLARDRRPRHPGVDPRGRQSASTCRRRSAGASRAAS